MHLKRKRVTGNVTDEGLGRERIQRSYYKYVYRAKGNLYLSIYLSIYGI